MADRSLALSIRAKRLGLMILDARTANRKSLQECARVIGVPDEVFEAFELGERSPSLPELEGLAYWFKVPIEQFWGDKLLSAASADKETNLTTLIALRQRVIGTLLRQARLDKDLSIETISETSGFSVSILESYELGDTPVPMPELEVLCGILNMTVRDFQDRQGLLGTWSSQQRLMQDFAQLSPDMQAFVSKPINRPYLELAMRLSEMSVDKLRAVAEGLLEITL